MGGKVTAASGRRMKTRERFVSLTPGPYFGVEARRGEKEPLLSIQVEGLDDGIGWALAYRVETAIANAFRDDPDYVVTKRRTA